MAPFLRIAFNSFELGPMPAQTEQCQPFCAVKVKESLTTGKREETCYSRGLTPTMPDCVSVLHYARPPCGFPGFFFPNLLGLCVVLGAAIYQPTLGRRSLIKEMQSTPLPHKDRDY